jgi:hypothetical protein
VAEAVGLRDRVERDGYGRRGAGGGARVILNRPNSGWIETGRGFQEVTGRGGGPGELDVAGGFGDGDRGDDRGRREEGERFERAFDGELSAAHGLVASDRGNISGEGKGSVGAGAAAGFDLGTDEREILRADIRGAKNSSDRKEPAHGQFAFSSPSFQECCSRTEPRFILARVLTKPLG